MDPLYSNYTLTYPARRSFFGRIKLILQRFRRNGHQEANDGRLAANNERKKMFNFSKKFLVLVGLITVGLLGILGYIFFYFPKTSPSTAATSSRPGDNRAAISGPKLTKAINRDFNFPLKDSSSKVLSQVKYTVDSLEERDEIIVKGQKATAIQGKTFLILNLKLTNDYSQAIQVNTRDYVRLMLDDATDQLAADIHNDPIVVQPNSTKLTRIGFTVADNVKKIKLLVGELNGEKTTIDLPLQNP